MAAGFGGVGGVEDGPDGADARGPGFEDFLQVAPIDSTYGEPRYGDVGRRPARIIQRHGYGAWLGRGGINGADGDVGRAGGKRAERLGGRMGAKTQQGTCREKLRGIGPTSIEEILLAQMAQFSADFARDIPMIVYDQTDASLTENGKDLFSQAAHFIGGGPLGAELN